MASDADRTMKGAGVDRIEESCSNAEVLDYRDKADIRALLLGRRVTKVSEDHIRLDDGALVRIYANRGCGGCPSGRYHLCDLNDVDNVITAVDFVQETTENEWGVREKTYRVFVVAEDKRVNLFAVEGSDGSGYYGSGYELLVVR